jgi:UDP-N-acetylglucosamine 4-epimerase
MEGFKMSAFTHIQSELLSVQKHWLVTGAAGFIGSNIAEFLLKHNQIVIAVDNFSTGYQKNIDDMLAHTPKEFHTNFTFIQGDVSDEITCKLACKDCDIILHQAALGSVPRSIEDPITTNRSNITGFLTLLHAAKNANIKRFVYASSSSVYGDSSKLPKVEEQIGHPLSPYAVTKYANELYARTFHTLFDLETIGLRYFNVFGRRQDPQGSYAAVIPKWIRALLSQQPTIIYGDGSTSRDFTYVQNVVQANILAGMTTRSDAYGDVFNVAAGGRDSLKVLHKIINDAIKLHNPSYQIQHPRYDDFRAGDILHSNADISKIKTILGYEPTYTLKEGMERTLEWYSKTDKRIPS